MGSNIEGESSSESDTREPMKEVTETKQIPDSDVEDEAVPNEGRQGGDDGNIREIIERINADSDDEEHTSEPPVDFGEEEEDDDAPSTPTKPSPPQEPAIADSNDDIDDDEPIAKVASKVADKKLSPRTKKKQPAKQLNQRGPSKTIKKSALDVKSKAKQPKNSQQSKKSDLTPIITPISENKSRSDKSASSPKSAKKVSPKASPKPASKNTNQKGKTIKPKKRIEKGGKPAERKPLVRTNAKSTAVKTFSKKGNQSVKTTSKGKPGPSVKKTNAGKSDKAMQAKQKSKSKKTGKDEGEEEENDVMGVELEDDSAEPTSDDDVDDVMHTPASKLPILGNLACSSRDVNAQTLLDHAVQQLGKYRVVSYGAEFDLPLSGYVVSSNAKRGWGVLQALASGVPLVTADWLSSSISAGSWQPVDAFRSDRFGQSPRSVAGTEAPNKLLDGLRIKVACEERDAASVRKLVTLCGARVAETRVHVVINDTKKKVEGGVNVAKKWLADSIEAGVAIEYEPYLVGG